MILNTQTSSYQLLQKEIRTMIDINEIKINRRGKDRDKTALNAQYFIKKQSSQYLECKVINLSRTGAAVSVPVSETLKRGTIMFVDIYIPKTLMHVSVQGEIKRVKNGDHECIAGIKFTELLDRYMFEQLTK